VVRAFVAVSFMTIAFSSAFCTSRRTLARSRRRVKEKSPSRSSAKEIVPDRVFSLASLYRPTIGR